MPTIQEKINAFNERYGAGLTYGMIAERDRVLAVMDDFMFDNPHSRENIALRYFNSLTTMIENIFKSKTELQVEGRYEAVNINLGNFLNEFEEIVAENNAQMKEPRAREAYEGMNRAGLIERMQERVREYDRPIFSIWATKMLKGKISYTDLKAITDNAEETLKNTQDPAQADRGALSNVALAYETMFRVRQSRGFFWKLFHLRENYREEKYLQALSEKRMEYVNKGYPVGDVLDATPNSMAGETLPRTTNAAQAQATNELRVTDEMETNPERESLTETETMGLNDSLTANTNVPTSEPVSSNANTFEFSFDLGNGH